MTDSASPPVTLKARKAPRLTYKQEIQTIKNLPRTQRLIVVMKIAGVFLVAIGLEGIVTGQYLFTFEFIPFPEMSEPRRERSPGGLARDCAHALRQVVHLRSVLRRGEERERRHGPCGAEARVDARLRGALIPERPSLRDEVPDGSGGQ